MGNTSDTTSTGNRVAGAGAFLVGNLLMVADELIFGMNYSVQKLLIPEWMSAIGVTASRVLGAAVLFWAASMFVKREKIQRSDWWILAVAGTFCVFGFMLFYALALQYASVISVSLVMTSQPVLIILINAWLYRFRVSAWEVVGVVIALAGAVAVALADSGHASTHATNPLLGDLFALITSLCYAFYISITRKISLKYSPVTINRWLFLFASLPAVFFIDQIVHAPLFHSAEASWLNFGEWAFVIVMASFLAYFLVPPAIRDIGDDLVGIYGYLSPVFAAVISVIIGVDVLRWYQPVLFAVIICGVVIITLAKRRLRAQGRLFR